MSELLTLIGSGVILGAVVLAVRLIWGRRRGGGRRLLTLSSSRTRALRGHQSYKKLAAELTLFVEVSSPTPAKEPGVHRRISGKVDGFPLQVEAHFGRRAETRVELTLAPPLPVRFRCVSVPSEGGMATGDAVFDAAWTLEGEGVEATIDLFGPQVRERLNQLLMVGREVEVDPRQVRLVVRDDVVELRRLRGLVQRVLDVGAALRHSRHDPGPGEGWGLM